MTPMQELKHRLETPERKGVLPVRQPLHLQARCPHGRPTLCWQCPPKGHDCIAEGCEGPG